MNTMLETVETFRYVTREEEPLTEIEAKVLGKRVIDPSMLRTAGFKLFVKPELALKFKYAASIYNLAQNLFDVYPTRCLVVDAKEDPKSHWGHKFTDGGRTTPVKFGGKLPLWVANRVRLAVGMGVSDITIHSNESLELVIETDPTIIGWVGFSPLWDWLVKNKGKMPRWYYSVASKQPKEPFGFVIAIFGDSDVI
ncbi:hypothetical protein LCGC14_2286470 [marine sediment metagenome]|uniref:Uncharacterized protein n=1 Tax=marine sediment metagenome TaxID=412755 RepID=A0A0F9FMS1_9ZZZZ